MDPKTDYLKILNALKDIPFAVGKKLLIDYLQGNEENESIARNGLFNNKSFGSLAYTDLEIEKILDVLLSYELARYTTVPGKKFWKVLELTPKGKAEFDKPSLTIDAKPKIALDFNGVLSSKISPVTEEDKQLFNAFGKILENFNDEQKKAIISNKNHILCIAGAGSGKTTVLTKRIEFLINYKSVNPQRILAITFTRKARTEMMQRLQTLSNTSQVRVETFNSFCEQLLKIHGNKLYNREVRVITYPEKFMIINKALSRLNTTMDRAINAYFTPMQRRLKTNEQLANIFMNDCFFIRDYMKLKSCDVKTLAANNNSAKLVFDICAFVESYMFANGLRDFADQLTDTLLLFEKYPSLMPKFDHILIDEYQDINSTQIKLIDVLNPENIFAVGDPRQSIYGWRGSDNRYLLNFSSKYPDSQLLLLTDNYRSTPAIVNLINESIKDMGLADLQSKVSGNGGAKLLHFASEAAEFEFIIQKIISSNISRKEIFVLARTNRQLVEFSTLLNARRISHVLRSDELRKSAEAKDQDITLATIHAIKGLEAEMVFVIGCTTANFPCRGTEHPVVEMVKLEEYDKELEEKRLFYVAMSRAKKELYLTYSGNKHTTYITLDMLNLLDNSAREKFVKENKIEKNSKLAKISPDKNDSSSKKPSPKAAEINLMKAVLLKKWRSEKSSSAKIPAYMILHDSTINDLAQKMPMTLEDLKKIHGLGPAKIKKYGHDILEILNS
ncbi:MAG TPA: ATP-dependent DNA helicase UvrD2 [Alphaproteobacteria bacterium]|nr:ATP-dependent DNA helicase UvrD2 [Alphaproteobacteria bacterium]